MCSNHESGQGPRSDAPYRVGDKFDLGPDQALYRTPTGFVVGPATKCELTTYRGEDGFGARVDFCSPGRQLKLVLSGYESPIDERAIVLFHSLARAVG